MSKKYSRLRIYLQIFMVTIKQIPTDNSLTASTNVISMQYPNTILNTKMTLPQLVGPIDVVSPEHSSGDRSHEFQIASPKNASIEFSKAEYARSHQSRTRTLYHFSSFIQICTKPEAFLAHQPKILDISTLLAFARSIHWHAASLNWTADHFPLCLLVRVFCLVVFLCVLLLLALFGCFLCFCNGIVTAAGLCTFFFRPTPSWLSPGRLTRLMALQKQ